MLISLINKLCQHGIEKLHGRELVQESLSIIQAIQTLYKPNVHRQIELVYSTLAATPNIYSFSELVLEKTHQRLKRGLRKPILNMLIFKQYGASSSMTAKGVLK